MDSNNYVAPNQGSYVAVVNGQQVGPMYGSQQQAEAAYNAAGGPTGTVTAPAAGSTTPIPTTTIPPVDPNAGMTAQTNQMLASNAAQKLVNDAALNAAQAAYWQGLLSGDSAKLAEQKAEFAANQAIAQKTQQLAAQNQAYTQGMGVLGLVSSLQGPANAFTQQAVLHGLNANGLSNAVSALSGNALPTFQANQATPQAASLQSLISQIYPNATFGAPAAGQTDPNALPSIRSIIGGDANWTGAPANTTGPGASGSGGGLTGNALTAYQVLTANNGSPAAGLSEDTFQAYMNTHNGTLPVDAYALADFANKNPGITAASTASQLPPPGSAIPNYDPGTLASNQGIASGGAGQPRPPDYGRASPAGMINGMQAADGTWYDAAKYPNGPPSATATGGANSFNAGTSLVPGQQVTAPGAGALPGGATTADYVNGLPAPNKIVSRNFNALDPDTQKFLLAAYQQAGYSANDVTNTIAKTQPQFTAPAAGSIAA